MLDLELVTSPTETALDIVSVADMKRHLRISASNTAHDQQLEDILIEVVDTLDGYGGELNRTLMPRTWRRYLHAFPTSRLIQLPVPPLISVESITYGEGSPAEAFTGFTVRHAGSPIEVGLIELAGDATTAWPTITAQPRAVAITFRAGFETYPPKLKRLIKILAAHYFENPEATINEPRMMMINRKVTFGRDHLLTALKVPNAYDDWE